MVLWNLSCVLGFQKSNFFWFTNRHILKRFFVPFIRIKESFFSKPFWKLNVVKFTLISKAIIFADGLLVKEILDLWNDNIFSFMLFLGLIFWVILTRRNTEFMCFPFQRSTKFKLFLLKSPLFLCYFEIVFILSF